ncbi:MAG: hypothetical protein QNL63_02450 [Paracoccaceae bacterium]
MNEDRDDENRNEIHRSYYGQHDVCVKLVQAADLQPDGDIRLPIGFGAGGSADVM